MKTQLLEDIGENAALPPAPFKKPGNSKPGKALPDPAPAGLRAAPAAPAHKPVAQPAVFGTPGPDQEPTPLELDSVFEEIAALEAQYVAPRAQPEPATARPEPATARPEPATARPEPATAQPEPATARPEPATARSEPATARSEPATARPEPAVAPAEPRLAPRATPAAAVPPDPEFDFTPPSPARQAPDPFAPDPFALAPGGQPPLVRPAAPLPARQPSGPTAAPRAQPAAAVPPAPVFDFTPPAPAFQAADPFARVPPEPRHPPVGPAAEAAPAPILRQAAPVAPDPVFDFTPPAPEQHAADPFTRAGSGRSGRRYLVWALCLLAAVLLILGGRWFYQERHEAGSLALVANQAQAVPKADKDAPQPASAKEDVAVTPAAPASRASPAVPPMVMLERDPSAAAPPERAPEPMARQDQASTAAKPEPVAEQAPPARSPKPASRVPARQSAAAAVETGQPEVQDTSMTATLKACRQRGYDAAQCVKRACSMTKYGFACRGR